MEMVFPGESSVIEDHNLSAFHIKPGLEDNACNTQYMQNTVRFVWSAKYMCWNDKACRASVPDRIHL